MLVPPIARRGWRAGARRAPLLAPLAALLLALVPAALPAQVVERPEPFDSAGRLPAITPVVAARLGLRPPAWRITGDYRDARLYSLSGTGYVIVVTRPNTTVERYVISDADRAYLRERTRDLPSGIDAQISQGLAEVERLARGGAKNAFVRDQTILGLTVYAPSFAYAVTNEAAGRVATYLIAAGASFFGATTYAREYGVSPTQNRLATLGAVHVGAAGYGVTYALGASDDGQAAGIFVGSLAGTATGLYFGQGMTAPQIAGAAFGADAFGLAAAGLNGGAGNFEQGEDRARVAAATIVGAAALGAPLGAAYPKLVRYNVTAGDISTLWFTGGLGALGATALVADSDPTDKEIMLALTGGFAVGAVAGDRLLVKRMDHTAGDAGLVGLGALAGALMGAGVSVLIDTDRSNDALIAGLATLGGVGGVAASEYYAAPRADAGRLAAHFRFSPTGLAMAAARREGVYPILNVTF